MSSCIVFLIDHLRVDVGRIFVLLKSKLNVTFDKMYVTANLCLYNTQFDLDTVARRSNKNLDSCTVPRKCCYNMHKRHLNGLHIKYGLVYSHR